MVIAFRTRKVLTFISMALVFLAIQSGCVASRQEMSSVENRTLEIQDDLDRLQKQIDQRLRAIEGLDGRYDYNNSLLLNRHRLDRVINSIVKIETQTVFESYRVSERVVKVASGIGVVVGPYVLTLNHVVTQDTVEVLTPLGEVSVPAEKLNENAYIVSPGKKIPLKQIFRDEELDIALFEIPGNNDLDLPSLPCPVGNSDELYVGNFLYVVGNPFNSGINMREGIVSSLLGIEGVDQLSANRSDLFVISNGVLPGDSGGPVLVLRDGVPELVGLVQGTLGITRVGWAIKINPILKTLSKHVKIREFCTIENAGPSPAQ